MRPVYFFLCPWRISFISRKAVSSFTIGHTRPPMARGYAMLVFGVSVLLCLVVCFR